MSDPEPTRQGTRTGPLADETAVVAAAVGGDRSAFAQLMEHYQGACYGLAWRLLGDRDLAADATQDAFIHAYDHLQSYRGGAFRSWLMRITANAAYDILRRAQRRPTTALPNPDAGEPDIPDPFGVNPVVESARSELYRALDVALRMLPEEQRTVIILSDVYGMDYQEVSVVIQSPVGTVKSRIHRGRLRLRELLADKRELFEG
jgi:RNA polymerase sigma-70 factor (ECF subfamily)